MLEDLRSQIADHHCNINYTVPLRINFLTTPIKRYYLLTICSSIWFVFLGVHTLHRINQVTISVYDITQIPTHLGLSNQLLFFLLCVCQLPCLQFINYLRLNCELNVRANSVGPQWTNHRFYGSAWSI